MAASRLSVAPSDEPEHPAHQQDGKEQQVIAREQSLDDQRGAEDGEPTPLGCVAIAVERRQRGRHAEPAQQFEVLQVRDAVRAEAVRQTAEDRGIVPARDREPEPVRRQRRQRERRQQCQVRGGHRTQTEPLQRRRDQALAEAMVGERNRARRRPEPQAVPPPVSQRRSCGRSTTAVSCSGAGRRGRAAPPKRDASTSGYVMTQASVV